MAKTFKFGYARASGKESFKDGVLTVLEGGAHVRMWSGENAYFIACAGGQDGSHAVVLASSIVDSVDVPTRKWATKCRGRAGDWLPAYRKWAAVVAREVAAVIGEHCDAPSVERIGDLILKHVLDT